MKYKNTFLIAIAAFCIAAFGCKKDNDIVPNASVPPNVALSNEIIITTLGAEFFLEADLKDAAPSGGEIL